MSRKTDGILFELHPRPTQGEDGQALLYARPCSGMKREFAELEAYCARHFGTNYGEMHRLFDCFINVASTWLAEGYRVETPIGSFAPKLKMTADFTDPEKVSSSDVELAGIGYAPSKRFLQAVSSENRGCRKLGNDVGNAQMYDEQAMAAALQRSMQHGYATISSFRRCSGLKYKSAKRYLDSLCEGDAPLLRRYKEGATLHYEPCRVGEEP